MKFALEQSKIKLLYKNHLFSIFIKAGWLTIYQWTTKISSNYIAVGENKGHFQNKRVKMLYG